MLLRRYTKKFKKTYNKAIKSGVVTRAVVERITERLANEEVLEFRHHDHALTGTRKGYRECHVRPDLLLIYKVEKDILILVLAEIGSHSELFE